MVGCGCRCQGASSDGRGGGGTVGARLPGSGGSGSRAGGGVLGDPSRKGGGGGSNTEHGTIYMVCPLLVPGCCLISVICSCNLAFVWPNLGTKERGCATILQLRILDPRLLGDVQCDNLEFKIEDFNTIFSEILQY